MAIPHWNISNVTLEIYGAYTFGIIGFIRLPLRDDDNLQFEQFIVDSWASFLRTYNPNPDSKSLAARGHINTSAELSMAGLWKPVKEGVGR
ncbi:hypothetical protein N431DRAFT_472891 [Stipitochalara longipes BDJ]|nr:hypothetical protein N431DRAFT_472891 [Stipitochalara longipes BDJ]